MGEGNLYPFTRSAVHWFTEPALTLAITAAVCACWRLSAVRLRRLGACRTWIGQTKSAGGFAVSSLSGWLV